MLLLATMAFGQAKEDAGDGKMLDKQTMEFKDYLPEIHGTIRGKYEYQTETSESRFEVRNARFSVSGNVHPIVAYKAEIDLSDEGSIKMLDAYARVFPVKDLNFTIGQMRVPFTIDAHRSPHHVQTVFLRHTELPHTLVSFSIIARNIIEVSASPACTSPVIHSRHGKSRLNGISRIVSMPN